MYESSFNISLFSIVDRFLRAPLPEQEVGVPMGGAGQAAAETAREVRARSDAVLRSHVLCGRHRQPLG